MQNLELREKFSSLGMLQDYESEQVENDSAEVNGEQFLAERTTGSLRAEHLAAANAWRHKQEGDSQRRKNTGDLRQYVGEEMEEETNASPRPEELVLA